MPIDDLQPDPLRTMEVSEDPQSVPLIVAEFERIASDAEQRLLRARALPREQFYAAARAQGGRNKHIKSYSSSPTRRPLAAITMFGTEPSMCAFACPARPIAQRSVPSTFHQ